MFRFCSVLLRLFGFVTAVGKLLSIRRSGVEDVSKRGKKCGVLEFGGLGGD